MYKESVIIESPVVQSVIVESASRTKARCKAILQVLNVPGQNRRKYLREVVESELRNREFLMKQKSFLGELDHPITDDPVRNSIVLLEKACHVILDAWIEDDKVYGIIETLSTDPGKTFYNLAVHDKIPVGFSLRALGTMRPENGIQVVTRMTMVTYDAVSNPSFVDARIKEINIQEIAALAEQQKPLLESAQPTICIGGVCYLVEHLDKILEHYVVESLYKILWGF